MGDYYLGEIVEAGWNFAPMDFLPCDGRLVQIAEYSALYSLIGTAYGGDGTTTFGLPNLNGRAALAAGAGPGLTPYNIGQAGGVENLALTSNTMPAHSHTVNSDPARVTPAATPAGNIPAGGGTLKPYVAAPDTSTMHAAMIQTVGGGQVHENRQPFQCLNFVICVNGLWPPRE